MKKSMLLFLTLLAVAQTLLLAQPNITQPPTNQVLSFGETVSLSVTASGAAPLAYQWFKDSRLLLGATNSTLTVANAGVTNSGIYSVVVTNAGGMVISLPVSVAVGNPCLLAWGYNYYGQLGYGTSTYSDKPNSVASNVVAGAAGQYHSLFVKTDGTLWAMGWNYYVQLGIGSTVSTIFSPVSVASNVMTVTAGLNHSLFIKRDGTLWAMGYNEYGELGNGTAINTNSPVWVASNVVAVTAGFDHSLFMTTDGTLWGMGRNELGELGNSQTNASFTMPIRVTNNVVAVSAGAGHSLFMMRDKTLWAMGGNLNGQLGNGTFGNYYANPICVASNVVSVVAGGYHSFFVKTNGTLWAMGYNKYGQLGNGTAIDAHTPVSVASNVVAGAGGSNFSFFVKTNGMMWAMGENDYGQLGNGTTSGGAYANSTPTNVLHLSVANVSPESEANHSLAVGILQALATVTLGSLNQLYTGSAISVTATTTPPGLIVSVTYNGSPLAPTNAGSYTVIGTVSDPNYYGSATNTLVVGFPPQSFTASNSSGVNGPQLTLQLSGTPAYPYILQTATNLTPPVNWQSVFTNLADVNGNWSLTLSNLTEMPGCFYRAFGQ